MSDQQVNKLLRMAELTAGYLKEELSPEEQYELEQWVAESEDNRALFEEMKTGQGQSSFRESLGQYDTEGALEKVHDQMGRHITRQHTIRRIAYMAAASVALLLAGALLLWNHKHIREQPQPVIVQHDVPPGGNRATLTLANGSVIMLDSLQNGLVSRQGNTKIVKLNSGQLAYHEAGPGSVVEYNTLTTPRGGQYEVVLSDGTKVWLNAASSLRYPSAFTGKERNVALTGEAYFEVAHHPAHPFMISVNGVQVQDIGTEFNVMAYQDEPSLVTTVVKGSVQVTKGSASMLLTRDQQAAINGNKITKITGADVEEAIAWKENHFRFEDADIKTVMRQIARWYDVQVSYKGVISRHFSGSISRNVNVSVLFDVLQRTGGVHFEIEGRNITVMP